MKEKEKKFGFHFRSIRSRMLLGFLSIFLAAVIFMGSGIYLFTARLLEQTNQESYENILESAENILYDKFTVNTGTARWLLGNAEIQRVLEQPDDSRGIYMNQKRLNSLNEVCRSYVYNIGDLAGLYLFDNNGKLYYEDLKLGSSQVEMALDRQVLEETEWYRKAMDTKGKEVFLGYDVIAGLPDRMSCVKILNRLNTMEKIGLMVLSLPKDTMKNVIGQFPTKRDAYVMKYRDEIVYQNGYLEESSEMGTLLQNKENRYLITEKICEDPDWRILHIVLRSEVFAEAGTIRNIILLIAGVAALLMGIFCIVEARQITRPLERLKVDIQRVGEGERSFSHTFEDDEVGIIGKRFQSMVTEQLQLKEKAEKEELLRKDSELQLLQSQINPHFLYNTLDTLYWMAISEDAEQSAELTHALSDIFKISLSEGREWIAVKDEIKFIEEYLFIQNVRFSDKFLVTIRVDEKIRDILIIKQILQPFVENAIYHGLEPKLGKGSLCVEGWLEEHFLVFTVRDDGAGIEDMEQIWKGYAVSNVFQRLKLHYGEAAELNFESEVGKGTTVTIRIPLKNGGRQC